MKFISAIPLCFGSKLQVLVQTFSRNQTKKGQLALPPVDCLEGVCQGTI